MSRTPLTPDQIEVALIGLPGWELVDGQLTSTRQLPTFMAALAFVAQVGDIAEGLDHHPDIDIRWRTVRLAVCTHDQGNQITDRDLELARAIDAAAA